MSSTGMLPPQKTTKRNELVIYLKAVVLNPGLMLQLLLYKGIYINT